MPPSLSREDVDRLLAAPLPPARIELVGKLAQDLTEARLSTAELQLGQDILRLLARDVEVTVRAALSSSLQSSAHLPRDVALRLARDVEEVALPILAQSLVLSDDD
ncbi:MAG: hypothetical protein J0H57_03460, partial [Rhodospirillales bacterium]|nr:hypothetical protein [Rhodospirillales bacterium]